MEFDVKRRETGVEKLDHASLALARKFAAELHKEFGDFIKVVTLFGSSVKKKNTKDIDVLVVIDDVTIVVNQEIAETYRIIVEKLVLKISTKLHITTLKLSTFWEYVRAGDPVGVNILRDGVSIIDTGIFTPLKQLLGQGRIRPTKESIWNYFMKVPDALNSSRNHLLKGVVDMYWAVIDGAHSALMSMDEVPPSPEHVPDLLKGKLLPKKLVTNSDIKLTKELYVLMKKIEHGEVKTISGTKYEDYYKKAVKFSAKMKKIVTKRYPSL